MPARLLLVVSLVLLTALAFGVRLNGLDWRDGDLSTDEARLALAADGVRQTALPILPSGRLYTRGLVTIYATAPSLALFGVHDWSARLPAVVMGALLVPALFLLARVVAGTAPALAAAAFAVFAAPLVVWSRQAWPPATFLLLFTLTAYAAYRGFGHDEGRWQVLAGVGFVLTLLAYELAMILPVGVGLYVLGRTLRPAARRLAAWAGAPTRAGSEVGCGRGLDLGWWRGRATALALALTLAGMGLLALLGLALRGGTLAGADAEFRHYFTPAPRLSGVGYYWRQVWGNALPLLLLVPAGLLWRRLRGCPVPPGLGYLLALLLVALLVPTFVIQTKQEQQYGLAVLPLVAALGAWSLGALWLPGQTRAGALAAAVVVLSFGLVLWGDAAGALRHRAPSPAPTWLDDLRAKGWRPDDPSAVVLAEAPLVTQLYLGRADFYIHPEGYERYAYQDGPVARSLYTPAVLLKEAGDFERLVAGPYAGRTLWVIGQDDRLPRLTRQMDPALWQRLTAASGVSRPTRGWWIMRLELPP